MFLGRSDLQRRPFLRTDDYDEPIEKWIYKHAKL